MKVYLCVLEPVLNPETRNPILAAGDLISPSYLIDLYIRYGIDSIRVKAVVAETQAEAAVVAYAP